MKFVPQAVSSKIARQALKVDQASPTLLFAVGVGGMVVSSVLACRATLRLSDALDQAKQDLNTSNQLMHLKEQDNAIQYTDAERQKDVAVIYMRSVVNVAKLYAPAVLVGAASIGCLTKSHNILNQRNLALTAAYAAVDEAFTAYRERVVEKYGKEQDEEFRYSAERVDVIDDSGKLSSAVRVGPNGTSMYARFFDEYSASWSKEPEYNRVFLLCQQNWANDMLKARGHLFLNEVYDALGLDRSKAGQVVGWVVSQDGDNYVDFGIFDGDNETVRDFVNGREGSILLDFNVDGIIYDKIKDPGERLAWQK